MQLSGFGQLPGLDLAFLSGVCETRIVRTERYCSEQKLAVGKGQAFPQSLSVETWEAWDDEERDRNQRRLRSRMLEDPFEKVRTYGNRIE